LKEKEKLEGQLADYNLAMDKTRTSTDPEDVQSQATHLNEKNRQTGQELDRIFKSRKQKEEDTSKVEDQIEGQYRAIQTRINELEPGKLRSYNDLLVKQREFQERTALCDNRLNEVNEKIRRYEDDDKTNSHRKEFSSLEKTHRTLKRDAEGLSEELAIAALDPKEAHSKFVARVNNFKQNTKG
jgi:archaellum component FlaC